jgi:hypothetical protein
MAARRLSSSIGRAKPPGQPDGGLLERHDLEAVTTAAACRQPALPHREAAVNYRVERCTMVMAALLPGARGCALRAIRSIKLCRCMSAQMAVTD